MNKKQWVNLKKAENENVERKNVESRGATKHVADPVRGASTFDIFQVNLSINLKHRDCSTSIGKNVKTQ